MGLFMEEYRRLKQLRNRGSSAGGSLKPSEDLISVRLKIDSEIAAYPDTRWKHQASVKPARLFALKPSYGWTVNMPLKRALGVACSGQLSDAGQGGNRGTPADSWGLSLSVGNSFGRRGAQFRTNHFIRRPLM